MSNEQTNVEHYDFDEPIKGYPVLNWKGKHPFRSTHYFPAQLKEVYGKEDENGWINKIFWGDNLQVMSHLLKEYRGQVDFIYIDPPFDSKANYKKKIKVKGKKYEGDSSSFEEKQYTDIWSNDEYLQFMYERLILLRELMSHSATIAVHCDQSKGHHLRCILDEIFGEKNFLNEIIWDYRRWPTPAPEYQKMHDNIYLYCKKKGAHTFNKQYMPRSEETEKRWKDKAIVANHDESGNRIPSEFNQEVSKGSPLNCIWNVPIVAPSGHERSGYPTQKPKALIEKLLLGSTNEGDLVFDCFMGSGSAQIAANNLSRRFIGADINLVAVQTATKRLSKDDADFEVYSVNNYEIFRNPVEAKDLLIEALEIQKLNSNTTYDGEKDGYKVKIMPVNRIATKADLDDLISNLPYKQFETRKEAEPNKPVEEIMLVCMGHELSLAADLENDVLTNGYKIKVKVVDILRDKSDFTFKYDSEASIRTENGKLVVDAFYPRNLLQKLSQQKDDVTEWREMVESIMIDWNYDGAVMEPALIDIPAKNDFVKGEYEIPEGASNIKIKITDLLSESYEEVIVHG
jgi:site-specific DNA-methyltransferase (adenine-specific)